MYRRRDGHGGHHREPVGVGDNAPAIESAPPLDIKVEEDCQLADYPRVKCNISRSTGERIYHLPFDQRYDATVIEPERGELYASTCDEAEDLGYRRAWRWRGNDQASAE